MRSEPPERLVALGAVAKPHGVGGELRVVRFNPDSTLLLEQDEVWLRRDGEVRAMRVAKARPHGELVLMTLEGVVGREAADALRGSEVCVPRELLPPPDEDELYHFDLIGLRALDPSGAELGVVAEVLVYPSTDCLAVETDDTVREIPLLEPYVTDVDFDAGTITIAHAEDFEPMRKKRRR